MQRFIDLVISLSALIFLLPLFILIMIILKFTGEGEIFYLQERIGKFGKSFKLIKFVTMLKNSPNIGSKDITIHNDPRVLKVGKFLRKSKINELPQLINIIRGDMSIVGPRPMTPNTFLNYTKKSRSEITKIRPGLTGIGSILFRDEEKFLTNLRNPIKFYNENIIPYKIELELWYLSNMSIFLYLKIIIITALIIIFPNLKLNKNFFKNLPETPNIFQKSTQ